MQLLQIHDNDRLVSVPHKVILSIECSLEENTVTVDIGAFDHVFFCRNKKAATDLYNLINENILLDVVSPVDAAEFTLVKLVEVNSKNAY